MYLPFFQQRTGRRPRARQLHPRLYLSPPFTPETVNSQPYPPPFPFSFPALSSDPPLHSDPPTPIHRFRSTASDPHTHTSSPHSINSESQNLRNFTVGVWRPRPASEECRTRKRKDNRGRREELARNFPRLLSSIGCMQVVCIYSSRSS